MPRKTTKEEAAGYIETFFAEAKQALTDEVLRTRQPKRRNELLKEIDALDRVNGRFYNWINGVDENAA